MFRKTCILGVILVVALYIFKCLFVFASKIQLADFRPVGVIFLLDISASNRGLQSQEEKTIVRICKRLDIEDRVRIYVVKDDAYLIYNENPHKAGAIKKAFEEHGKFDSKSYGTAYGLALKKAVDDALFFKSEGYKPAIVILGDLENEGDIRKQINWNKLPQNMKKTMEYIPELSLMLLYAHPKKLDSAREKLKSIIPDKQFFYSSEENVDLTTRRFLKSLH